MAVGRSRIDAYERRYRRWSAWLRERPRLVGALQVANKVLTGLFYGAYAALLVGVVVGGAPDKVLPLALVPGLVFAALGWYRRRYNAPRPYELCAIEPVIARDGAGCSFPSRHAFSAFAVAVAWGAWCMPAAVVLVVCACLVAALRVMGGVHFAGDVVAGACVGCVTGVLAVAMTALL